MPDARLVEDILRLALPFSAASERGIAPAVDAVMTLVDDSPVVLLGEATHGTREFYAIRTAITRALIERGGFNVIAVEADWPDAHRAHRWIRHASDDGDAVEALGDFRRFPRWMWRNQEIVALLEWLRGWNGAVEESDRVGFHGLDLYSLHASVAAVLEYLSKVDPEAAARARERYSCFDHILHDGASYGYAASRFLSASCEEGVIAQLMDLRRHAADYVSRDGRLAADEYFAAAQNARLVRSAEAYYRAMFGGRAASWNLRDTHMHESLEALLDHTRRLTGRAQAIVWAHNSHLGDARATGMAGQGEINLGELVRRRYGASARLIGFTTYRGTVTAAANWDEPPEQLEIRPGLPGSVEALFHRTGLPAFFIRPDAPELRDRLLVPRLERAIGVVYRPESERASHYFEAQIADQFDAVIHVDETSALEPLDAVSLPDADRPETFPSAL